MCLPSSRMLWKPEPPSQGKPHRNRCVNALRLNPPPDAPCRTFGVPESVFRRRPRPYRRQLCRLSAGREAAAPVAFSRHHEIPDGLPEAIFSLSAMSRIRSGLPSRGRRGPPAPHPTPLADTLQSSHGAIRTGSPPPIAGPVCRLQGSFGRIPEIERRANRVYPQSLSPSEIRHFSFRSDTGCFGSNATRSRILSRWQPNGRRLQQQAPMAAPARPARSSDGCGFPAERDRNRLRS